MAFRAGKVLFRNFREAWSRPLLFKRWVALSIRYITAQRLGVIKIHRVIQWIVIYPMESAIHHLND